MCSAQPNLRAQDKDKIYLSNFKHITSKAKVAFVFVFSMRDLVLKIVWMACCMRKRGIVRGNPLELLKRVDVCYQFVGGALLQKE